MKLRTEWFVEKDRLTLNKLIIRNQEKQAKHFASHAPYQKTNQELVYELSVCGAQAAFYEYVRYLLLSPTGQKPWLVPSHIEKPLSAKQFQTTLEETILKIQQKGPSVEYAGLVHMSALLNLLTRTEIVKNG